MKRSKHKAQNNVQRTAVGSYVRLAVGILFVWMVLLGQASAELTATVKHDVRLNQVGYVSATIALTITNPRADQLELREILIHYPAGIDSPITAKLNKPQTGSVAVVPGDAIQLRLSFPDVLRIPPSANQTVEVQLSYGHLLKLLGKNYTIGLPLFPGFSLPVTKADLSFEAPDSVLSAKGLEDFRTEAGRNVRIWKKTVSDLKPEPTPRKLSLEVKQGSPTLTALSFPRAEREIVVTPAGDIHVRDRLTIVNNGLAEVSELAIKPLNTNLKRVVLLPTEEPPLMNQQTVNVVTDNLLLSGPPGSNLRRIAPEDKRIVKIEYPIGKNHIESTGSQVNLRIPVNSPIEGVVDSLTIRLSLPEGYVYTSQEKGITVEKVSPVGSRELIFGFRPGYSWASQQAGSIAALVFVTTLAALGFHSFRMKGTKKPELSSKLRELRTIYEEKNSLSEEALRTLYEKRLDGLTKSDIDRTRRLLEDVRNRTSSRLADLKLQRPASSPEEQRILTEGSRTSREYDRIVRQIVDVHETYLHKRIRKDNFDARLSDLKKRKERLSADLTDKLDNLAAI